MSLKPKKVDFTETWQALQETVKCVITLNNVPRSIWNDRFTDVYSLCVAYPEPLADRLYLETKEFLDNHVKNLLVNVRAKGEVNLLKSYYEAWSEYSLGINYLHLLYLYLNQQHIKKQKLSEAEIIFGNLTPDSQEQMEIGELGFEIWKKNMIEPLKEDLVNLLLEGIHCDRVGDGCPTAVHIIKGVIQSFVTVEEFKKKVKLYEDIFEAPFLQASGEYYKQEASRLLQECNVSLYMERVSHRLKEEQMRSQRFLNHTSFNKVKEKCEQHMIVDHLEFLHGECKPMIQEERRKDLTYMYSLLRSIPHGIPLLINEMLDHIKQQGLQCISNLGEENVYCQFVDNMLDLHKKYKDMISEVFAGDQAFIGALDRACSSVVNYRAAPKVTARAAEMLAKYYDFLLKRSAKGMSEAEIDDRLARSIIVFKYLDDKDVFQKFYSRMLARRLIHQQSQSMDAEEAMINRLKDACGYEFTNKFQRMFNDITVSSDLNSKFSAFLKSESCELGISFLIYVLQAGAWPLGQTAVTPFNVPQELEKSVQMFEKFYHSSFNGRRLTWLHHLCHAEVKLSYLKKPYQITMQTFQMAILLLFETTDNLTCKEIQDTLQLNSEQFSKHVASLLDSKLLLTSSEDISPETVLSLNLEYNNKRTKFRITAALQRESPQEVEQTLSSVDEDRKLYLQAAIVRIMRVENY